MTLKENPTTANVLWNRMRFGDSVALQELYSMYYQYLFGAGYSLCLDKELTKDCIHDLFLNLWVKREQLDSVASVGGYLRTCIRRKIIDILKKEQFLAHNISSDDYIEQFSYEEVIIAFQTEQETKRKLEKALTQLTKKQREVIRLRFFENKNFEEIALLLNSEPRTIYNHMYEAMKQLRCFLSSTYIP